MKYSVEVVSGGIIYIIAFMTICSGIHVVSRAVPQRSEMLQRWYY